MSTSILGNIFSPETEIFNENNFSRKKSIQTSRCIPFILQYQLFVSILTPINSIPNQLIILHYIHPFTYRCTMHPTIHPSISSESNSSWVTCGTMDPFWTNPLFQSTQKPIMIFLKEFPANPTTRNPDTENTIESKKLQQITTTVMSFRPRNTHITGSMARVGVCQGVRG